MTFESLVLVVLLALALVAFFRETLPIEVTALGLLAALVVLGVVPQDEAFTGFSNKAVITIGALFVLVEALARTGVLERIADGVSRKLASRSRLATAVFLGVVGLTSGFLNNTAVVAMFIPLVMTLCARFSIRPSKLLLPLSYASIFGGTLTLIGTSTNLLVSSVVEQAGRPPLRMFEFTKLGLIFFLAGLVYVTLFSERLLPDVRAAGSLTTKYSLDPYLTEIRLRRTSKLIGRTVLEARLNERYGVLVLEILRDDRPHIEDVERVELQAGDHLLVEGRVENLSRLADEQGVALLPEVKLSDGEFSARGLQMVEGVVMPAGAMEGKTLKEIDFHRRFGGFVLALRRPGATLRSKVGRVTLHAADSLLMLLPEDRLEELRQSRDLVVVTELGRPLRRRRLWWLVLVLLPVVVALAALDVVDISIGAPLAAVVLLVAGALTPQQAYRSLNWTVLFLIAAFIPIGNAVTSTGLAAHLASALIAAGRLLPGDATPYLVLSLLYLATSLATEVISNNAAAIILVPIALNLGPALGVDSRPFVMAVCFAASAAFMTPMGYQTNLMVYGPGGYRFQDYVRFGVPLNLLFWLLASTLIPQFWPF